MHPRSRGIPSVRRRLLAAAVLTPLCAAVVAANEPVTLTVLGEPRQQYLGFGMGSLRRTDFTTLPSTVKDEIVKFLHQDLKIRHIRMWIWMWYGCEGANDPYCYDYHFPYWADYLEHAMKYSDDLVLSFAPTGDPQGEMRSYANKYVELLARMNKGFAELGLPLVRATGIANEPDVGDNLLPGEVPELTTWYRRLLDANGLDSVKVIAPENSACNWKAYDFVTAVKDNPEAMEALGAFATHSYNESITEEMERIVGDEILSGRKEYWMTEAADDGPEGWYDTEQATSVIARFLADVNHLANVWIFFLGNIGERESDWGMDGKTNNRITLLLYRKEWNDWRPLLKCWYIKQLNATFDLYCRFRKAHTNLYDPDGRWWRREDSTMVWAFGQKAPLYGAVAANPDGSYAIGITNYTGKIDPRPFAQVRGTTVFDATVRVEELADRGEIKLAMHRCDSIEPFIHFVDTITMRNGEFTVTVEPMTFLTFRSSAGTVKAGPRKPGGPPRSPQLSASTCGNGEARITFTVPSPSSDLRLSLYNMRGACVRTLAGGPMQPGGHEIVWDGRGDTGQRLAGGAYMCVLTTPSGRSVTNLMLAR